LIARSYKAAYSTMMRLMPSGAGGRLTYAAVDQRFLSDFAVLLQQREEVRHEGRTFLASTALGSGSRIKHRGTYLLRVQ
jgi:hypothetical protein